MKLYTTVRRRRLPDLISLLILLIADLLAKPVLTHDCEAIGKAKDLYVSCMNESMNIYSYTYSKISHVS